MSPLIPILGSVVGAFVGRLLYFGSEQSSSLMTIPLYGIVLFFCCALRGFFGVSLTRRYGRGLVLVIDTCLYFLVALYLGSFRIYTGLLLLSIICPVVSNEGGVILSMVSGDGSASSVNQPTPTYSTQPGSSSETGDNVIPPSPGEGPSHQGSVVRNESLESSMRFRIVRLELDNSPYLLDKARGDYWAQIRHELDHVSSQRDSNSLLEFENRDLRIREQKQECFRLFNRVLSEHPYLAGQAPYKPNEVFDDFLDELLDKQAKEPVVEKDKKEIAFLEGLRMDLQNNGPNTILPIFNPTSTSNR